MNKIITYCIILLSIVVLHDFSNSDGQNLLMLGLMFIAPIFIFVNKWKLDKSDLLFIPIVLLMFLSSYFHPSKFRISTVLYSTLFITQFLAFKTLLRNRSIGIFEFRKLLFLVFYAFVFVLIQQQVFEIMHTNGFNRFGLYDNRFKMNSLAQEPSALAPTLILLLFGITRIDEILSGRLLSFKECFLTNKYLWISFFYVILSSASATNLFITPIFILYFFRKKIIKYIPFIALGLVGFYSLISYFAPENFVRFNLIMYSLSSLNPHMVYDADPSGSARIAPYLFYIQDIDLNSFDFWFGKGVDFASNYMSYELRGFEEGSSSGIGGFANFGYDYGFTALLLFVVYLRANVFKSFKSYLFLLWLLVFSIQSFNVALFWAFNIIVFAINYFQLYLENSRKRSGFINKDLLGINQYSYRQIAKRYS